MFKGTKFTAFISDFINVFMSTFMGKKCQS